MSTATRESIHDVTLIPSRESRRLAGFGNLLRKELSQWWTTRMWWIQTLIWVLVINGISTIVAFEQGGMTVAQHFVESVRTPFLVGVLVVGIGIVVTVQGSIAGEKDQGTAAWVMSKPVSRSSFVMSKIVAHSLGFLATAVLVPSIVAAIVLELRFPGMLVLGGYAIGVAILALSTVFYVTLTVCLGTLFEGRGAVAGIGIAFLLTGQFLHGMLPEWLVMRTPWPLGEAAASYAASNPPEWSFSPIVATVIATIVLGAVAMRRFGRDEF